MTKEELRQLLEELKNGSVDVERAVEQLSVPIYTNLGHTRVDDQRELRTGFPEVIYCAGKTPAQVADIVKHMLNKEVNILGTRADDNIIQAVKALYPEMLHNKVARCFAILKKRYHKPSGKIAVVTAGTSDMPVAEEAAMTAEVFGNSVERYYDVGVAGIHRLYHAIDSIREARVIIVVAGMEGALPSVVGGLVDKPVIAVPTSIGYGANFGGLSALLGMLTSCASGVSVVNIDNGFGAGYMACLINRL